MNDGNYHFRHFERHYEMPRKKNHFSGKTWLVIGGSSFSATSLVAATLKHQDNITLIGEETGGGAYGHSATFLPYALLPNSKIRLRLPLFKMVINKNAENLGDGVQPEILVTPSVESYKKGRNYLMDRIMEEMRVND